jgi:biotin carboxylase
VAAGSEICLENESAVSLPALDDIAAHGREISGSAKDSDMHVLVIGGKDSSFLSIRDLDVKVTLIQERADLTSVQRDKADNLIVFPTLDPGQVEKVAAALHASDPFDAVVSFFESCLVLAARVGNALGVKHNPLRAVELTRDKIAMRALLADEGIPTVRYRACTSAADCAEFLELIGAPVIIKPAGGTGSRGVTLATVPADIEQAWLNYSVTADGPAIAEEFVTGREFSVESITRNGIHEIVAITEKHTTGAPAFVECGHNLPAQVDDVTAESMHTTVTRLLDAVGHVWGPAHTEIMLTVDGRPVIIESQTRIGGDQIWEMVELTAGVRLAGATVAAMLGIAEPQSAQPRAGGAAIRFFVPTHSRVVAIDGVETACGHPGVIRVDMRAKPGDVLGGLTSSWSRQGYVLAVGTSPANAIATVEEAFDLVRIVTEADDNLAIIRGGTVEHEHRFTQTAKSA